MQRIALFCACLLMSPPQCFAYCEARGRNATYERRCVAPKLWKRRCSKDDVFCVEKAGVSVRYDITTRHGWFWTNIYWHFDWPIFCVFRQFIKSTSVVLDVGGWIGLTAIWFANVAQKGKVVVLEPSEKAFKELLLNIAANPDSIDRISATNVALGSHRGIHHITNHGTAIDRVLGNEVINSTLAISTTDDSISAIAVKPIADLVFQHPELHAVSFIKVDVEGYETVIIPSLLPLLKKLKPILVVSVHPEFVNASAERRLVNTLLDVCPYLHEINMIGDPIRPDCQRVRLHGALRGQKFVRFTLPKSTSSSKKPFDLLCTWEDDKEDIQVTNAGVLLSKWV